MASALDATSKKRPRCPAPDESVIEFVEPPQEFLKCSLCLDLFEDPVSLASCGHTFCRQCALDTLKQKRECPLDRKPCARRGPLASLFNPNFTTQAGWCVGARSRWVHRHCST